MATPNDSPTTIASQSHVPPTECATRFAIFSECPQCGHSLHAEHAHYKCGGCGWRDSCCDWRRAGRPGCVDEPRL